MSLNLISSLSFLKSKLGVKPTPAPKTSRLDLFAGITESDLDSSSSDSEDSSRESSRCVSPSTGYSTPDVKIKPLGPSADILQKCLDILNSDISDSETLPQPDVVKETPLSKPETQISEEKKTVTLPSQYSQGLLKIASPRREQEYSPAQTHKSTPHKDSFQPLSVNVSSAEGRGHLSPSPDRDSVNNSENEYPEPPELEPMVSLVKTTVPPTLTTTQARHSTSTNLASVQAQTKNNESVTLSAGGFASSATTLVSSASLSATSQVSSATLSAASLVSATGNHVERILLPPVQPGQAQQIIIQPSFNPQQQHQIIQQQQSFLGPGVPMVQIVQSGIPIQLTGSSIPLLSASGQLLGTLGGVNNQTTLLNNLQSFTALLQQNQNNSISSGVTQPSLQYCVNNPGISGLHQGLFTQNNLISQPKILPSISIKQEPISGSVVTPQYVSNSMPGLNQTFAPSFQFQNNLPSSGPIIFSSTQQSVPSFVSLPGIQNTQTSLSSLQSAPVMSQTMSQPSLYSQISMSQSSQIPMTHSTVPTSVLSQPTSAPTLPPTPSTTPSTAVVSATSSNGSPMAQLVQDPITGFYNLVSSPDPSKGPALPIPCRTPVPATSHLALTVPGSPKRLGTPISSSPNKVPKLLLPSLTNSKENRPVVDPPPTKFMCGVCNKFFGNTKNLRVHISEIHEGKRGQFPCDICNKVFPRKRNMERHKNALHLKNNPVCPLCQKVVVNIEVHIKRFHRGSQEFNKVSAATA